MTTIGTGRGRTGLGLLLAGVLVACGGGGGNGSRDPGAEARDVGADEPDDAVVPPDGGADTGDPGLDVPGLPYEQAFLVPELLGRPTATSIALNLVPAEDLEVGIAFGRDSGPTDRETASIATTAGTPQIVTLEGLQPDTRHVYEVHWRRPGEAAFQHGPLRSFHTQRPAGATFTFAIQADPHLDENSDLALYQRELDNVAADAPDFLLDLGDTFMCEKHSQPLDATVQMAPDAATVDARYLYERGNFGRVTHSVPLFLVNGNHEGEAGWLLGNSGDDIAVWATKARQRDFLNPVPDGFYGGDPTDEPFVGKRAAWYSWQWGDALFVVLDPYWYTMTKGGKDGWVFTLGKAQYDWLAQTLSGSTATFKFVFVHNLVGGLDGQMRGGIEAAPFYEWGGRNEDGTDVFAAKRPGWDRPIHALLVQNGVTAVFHGHDHVYVKQDLDGIVYQEMAQPSAPNFAGGPGLAAKQHYAAGTIRSSSGHLRVTVSPGSVKAEYVRAFRPGDETGSQRNGQVDDTWTVPAK